MTGFDLGEPAPDADDEAESEPDETTDQSESAEHGEESQADPTEESVSNQNPSSESSTETTPAGNRATKSEEETSNDDLDDEPDISELGPAFEYSEVDQNPLYAREKTWGELEDELGITITPGFREKGIRDDQLREVHDAILEVALNHSEEVIDRVIEKRIKSYRNEEF